MIFDNTNLAESYAGVTTPMTFTFARRVYDSVYQHFCRMMGVPSRTIDANRPIFQEMVVFIGYRLYYGLDNWYRMVSWLPGYRANRIFFEKMLGVKNTAGQQFNQTTLLRRTLDLGRLMTQSIRILLNFVTMGRQVDGFLRHFDRRYINIQRTDFSAMSISDLSKNYFQLTDEFTARWRVPIANDFAVMVSTGIANACWSRWVKTGNVYDYVQLEERQSLETLDPHRHLVRLHQLFQGEPKIRPYLSQGFNVSAIAQVMMDKKNLSPAATEFRDYLSKFGDRVPGELKLESETFFEAPEKLVQVILRFSEVQKKTVPMTAPPVSGIRWIVINMFIHWAQASLRRREETRFRRTLAFGIIRRIVLAAGERLKEQRKITSVRDIFWLEDVEIFQTKECKNDWRPDIEYRRTAAEKFGTLDFPARIETTKSTAQWVEQFIPEKKKTNPQLQGIIASTGGQTCCQGEVVIMRTFDASRDVRDKILVTRHTDPGWTTLFPLLRGLIVERGGMLSHAAIVAREYQIPCLVGTLGATDELIDASNVTMDLLTGDITHGKTT